MSDQPIASHAHRRWVLLAYWAIIFLLTHWPEIERLAPGWRPPHFDKFVHACMYAGWVMVWWWVLSAGGRPVSRAAANWLALGGLVYAIFDEATQALVDRVPSLSDLAADLIGILCAITLLQWRQRNRSPRRPASPHRPRG